MFPPASFEPTLESAMNRPIGASMTRREVFGRIGGGFGALGLAGAFGDAGLLGSRAAPPKGGPRPTRWPPSPRTSPPGRSGSSSCS